MEKERTTDKRKAQDKDSSDDGLSDITQGTKKRPRVDNATASTDETLDQNGPLDPDVDVAPTSGSNGSNGDVMAGNNSDVISKFDLPVPLTSQELAQKMGTNNCENDDNDSDDGSTKFLSGIIHSEKNKKAKLKTNGSPVKSKRNGGSPPVPSQHSMNTSSTISDTSQPYEFDVAITIRDPSTNQVLLDIPVFKSDQPRMDAFLRQHNLKLSSQSQSIGSSGYLGDLSSSDNSTGRSQGLRSTNRWTISSLGSTIPRESIVSIATDMTESPEDIGRRHAGVVSSTSKARKTKGGPIMTSTKIYESSEESSAGIKVKSGLVNGDGNDIWPGGKPKSPSKSPTKGKGFASPLISKDEGISTMSGTPSTPGVGTTPRAANASQKGKTPSNTPATSTPAVARSAGRKRRVGSANNFPITSTDTPPAISAVLSTPPPARGVAKIEGTAVKPLSKFEQEMNNEPVIEKQLEKSNTLHSTILPEEPVFARWRDRNYYSGVIKSKGMNDTWIIDYDDGMDGVASESHIIPLRILGVGIKGVYSPDETYKPLVAEIIGQKFVTGKDGVTNVKYAIKYVDDSGDTKLIFCSRRQLVLKEVDAKKLRPEVFPGVTKPGDVSLDNIVSGPRRRTRGGESEGNKPAGAFDVSSDITAATPTSTPKSRGAAKGAKNTPQSDAKKKRASTSNAATPQTKDKLDKTLPSPPTKDNSKSSTTKEVAEPDPFQRLKASLEIGKKKSSKVLFQKMEFFLTAAGGGDPGISGPQTVLNTYDKDELRETIEKSGGKVLDQVGDQTGENVFLISDGYARTVKYIYSLASGIPCVCHTWIQQCLELHEIVDWSVFILPAGWSLERQDLIPHHTKTPLKDFKIFVTSESDQLYNYWKPVLVASKAVLLKPPRKKGQIIPNGTQVVVTDNHSKTTKLLLAEAATTNIPVVKPEWLVQTIIVGERASMYGHEKYKVSVDDEENEENSVADTTDNSDVIKDPANDILQRMDSPD